MEYTEHYDDMEQRNNLCDVALSNDFRMLHDDFDEDWQQGDEPHGTLTFTDEPSKQAPIPEPSKFERLNPTEGVEHRLEHIEDFLEKRYPK